MSFFRRTILKAAKSGVSPFGVARKAGSWLGGYFVRRFAGRRFAGELEGDELEAFKQYMKQIVMRKGSSEYAFVKMFPNLMMSEHAISNHIEDYQDLGIEVTFYYGTNDWMNTKHNGKKVSRQLKDKGQKVYIVKDAGHHIYFGNPDGAFDLIYDDFCNSPNVDMS
jgi:pimeloyl-ACP methyl ester carboxylesterase